MQMRLAIPAALAGALIAVPAGAAPDKTLGPALLSAIVKFDGTLLGGAGPVSASQIDTGQFEVIFDRDVRDCTYVAMIGDAVFPRVAASTGRRTGEPNGVFVLVYEDTTPVNASFHLTVFCIR